MFNRKLHLGEMSKVKTHHYQLLDQALNKLGGKIMESYSLQLKIGSMDLSELLEWVELTSAPRRNSA